MSCKSIYQVTHFKPALKKPMSCGTQMFGINYSLLVRVRVRGRVGIENIFDVPVLHLGVWVSHRRFKPTHVWHHTHSLSVVVWKVASDHLTVSLERREGRGDDEQEPRSSACT